MAAAVIHKATMTTIQLTGSLAKKFFRTKDYLLGSESCNEAFSALRATIDGFTEEIKRLDRLGMRFAVYRNKRNVGEKDFQIGGTRVIKIVPVVQGAKRGGILQTVLGAVIIAVGVYSQQPGIVAAGVGMAAGGVIQMLSPQASGLIARKDYEQRRERQAQGIKKAKADGKYQRRPVNADLHKRVKELLKAGLGIRDTARHADCSTTTVMRIREAAST